MASAGVENSFTSWKVIALSGLDWKWAKSAEPLPNGWMGDTLTTSKGFSHFTEVQLFVLQMRGIDHNERGQNMKIGLVDHALRFLRVSV